MNQTKLGIEFSNFQTYFENKYRNSEYDITEDQFLKTRDWLMGMIHMLLSMPIKFNNEELFCFEMELNELKKMLIKVQE